MTGQSQQPLAPLRLTVLGVMSLIGDQHGARRGQRLGQARPAVQLQPQAESRCLALPMGMQTNRGNHQDAAIG